MFVSSTDGKLTAYDLTTGEQLWQNDSLLNRHLSNPVVLGSDLIVGNLYAQTCCPDDTSCANTVPSFAIVITRPD
ncbi:hypothetical protein ACFMJB_22200 [Acinetobacter baumannii]